MRGAVLGVLLAAAVSAAAPMSAQPTLPSLRLSVINFNQRLEPGARDRFTVHVNNFSPILATNVVLTVTLPAGGTIEGAGPLIENSMSCSTANNVAVCTAPLVSNTQTLAVEVLYTAPLRRSGEDVVIRATVTSAEADLDPADNETIHHIPLIRQFVVANVEDEGSGSLRQAILEVNALCPMPTPCAILFEIPAPVPASGWFTIQPRTPLPEIAGTFTIDGNTQTRFTGDTNPDGPEIEINGLFAREGSGLSLRPDCDVQVRNLAVNGFPGYGIAVRRMPENLEPIPCSTIFAVVHGNYLGTDPRGRTAKPNQRGLGLFTLHSIVEDNLISGNRRSGIYATEGFFAEIVRNRIGVGADGSSLGNGAGIYFDMGGVRFGSIGGADVLENVIAYNDGMAIARSRRGEIQISGNRIFDNLQQGIDVDLDGPTSQRANDMDVPNAPVLFSAAYDPARRVTIVRGRIDSVASAQVRTIEVYASARLSVWGTPQAEQPVATWQVLNGHEEFEIAVPFDLRGKWVTATYNAVIFTGFVRNPRGVVSQNHRQLHPADTSELSNAVMAQ